MESISLLLSPPVDLEAWLILGYVIGVLAGARLFEALARLHFDRARRYAERGFRYDPDGDHYHCPEGERLALHLIEPESRLAVYRAPACRCKGCHRKLSCTPHDEGRHIYRSLAEWAETDIGQFHQWLSLLMFAVGTVLSLIALARWQGQPGTGLLLVALVASMVSLATDLRRAWASRSQDLNQRA